MDDHDLQAQLAALSPAKRELLELQLKQQDGSRRRGSRIPRRAKRDSAPLSFAQQRLWILHQLEPESPAYNESIAERLRGTLNVAALQHALTEIVARHEVLRTTIAMVGQEPVQTITDPCVVELPTIDLRTESDASREEAARRILVETIRRPFALARDLPLRALLLRLTDHEHMLLVVIHHMACDGWSGTIFRRELGILYTAFASGQVSPLAELSVQYQDYAEWQRLGGQSEALATHTAYWKQQLDGVAALQLPLDRPRPPTQTFNGTRQSTILPKEMVDDLRAVGRREDATLFMTLLAAFQVVLHRYTGQQDIAVGSPMANRTQPELENLIGFFVNTLVLRTHFTDNPSFQKLLRRVRATALDAYAHQQVPFEKLVEELHPQRTLSHSPLFQVMFSLQTLPPMGLELLGLETSPVEVRAGTAKFDLSLYLVGADQDDQLRVIIEYNTDLFDDATITRMLKHYQRIVQGIVQNPGQRITELPLSTDAEQQQLLVEWNDTKRDYPRDRCVHQLFEAQVERTPEAVAVVYEAEQLTYRELNARANQLAHYLRKLDVGPEVLVGLCVERSLEMVVGILGILKAGGVYVPLDPTYPQDRLAFMLQDAHVTVLLTQAHLLAQLPVPQCPVLCVDRDREIIAQERAIAPPVRVSVDNLAYVLYTSGSTGQPKGVAIAQRNVAAFLAWAHTTFSPKELSRVLASTSLCFDLSVFELFAPLTSGGTVVVVDTALALAHAAPPVEVTLLNTVPSAIAELLRLQRIPPTVQTINLAGELLPTTLVDQLYASTAAQRVYDLYGPSEATTYATYTLRRVGGPQTIGRPIQNTQVYVLDAYLHPVPIGVVGEVYIGGDGVARGYLNRPELTAEKFLPDPFCREPSARLYKTGDLARYLPDGNLEFLGRIDHQVKLRGYRIELGEIETVLGEHPAVREAVVIAREDQPGDKRLVAYLVPTHPQLPTVSELWSFLHSKLPDYMIPSACVLLDTLPLTPNGKIDRQALPCPDHSRPALEAHYCAARTPTEGLLVEIWAEVLKLDTIGAHDNFFALGGHSLLATQVVARINKRVQIAVPLRALFECQTVAALAQLLDEQRQHVESEALDRILSDIEATSEEEVEALLAAEAKDRQQIDSGKQS